MIKYRGVYADLVTASVFKTDGTRLTLFGGFDSHPLPLINIIQSKPFGVSQSHTEIRSQASRVTLAAGIYPNSSPNSISGNGSCFVSSGAVAGDPQALRKKIKTPMVNSICFMENSPFESMNLRLCYNPKTGCARLPVSAKADSLSAQYKFSLDDFALRVNKMMIKIKERGYATLYTLHIYLNSPLK